MTIGLERKGALTKIFQATLEINKKTIGCVTTIQFTYY